MELDRFEINALTHLLQMVDRCDFKHLLQQKFNDYGYSYPDDELTRIRLKLYQESYNA